MSATRRVRVTPVADDDAVTRHCRHEAPRSRGHRLLPVAGPGHRAVRGRPTERERSPAAGGRGRGRGRARRRSARPVAPRRDERLGRGRAAHVDARVRTPIAAAAPATAAAAAAAAVRSAAVRARARRLLPHARGRPARRRPVRRSRGVAVHAAVRAAPR